MIIKVIADRVCLQCILAHKFIDDKIHVSLLSHVCLQSIFAKLKFFSLEKKCTCKHIRNKYDILINGYTVAVRSNNHEYFNIWLFQSNRIKLLYKGEIVLTNDQFRNDQRNYKKEAQIGKSNSLLGINSNNSQAHIPFHQFQHQYV